MNNNTNLFSESSNPIFRASKDGAVSYANLAGEELLKVWRVKTSRQLPNDWIVILDHASTFKLPIEREVMVGAKTYSFTLSPNSEFIDVFGRDVTAHRKHQRDLALFRYLMDHSGDAIYVFDPTTGACLDMNSTACGDLGYEYASSSRHKHLMFNFMDIDTNITTLKKWTSFVKSLRSKKHSTIESRFTRRDGSTVEVEVNSKFVNYEDSEFVICTARDITERKRSELILRDLAFKDPLTGLYNRRMFDDRMQQQTARNRRTHQAPYALLLLDLDDFTAINNTFGHEAGDKLLVQIAERMKLTFRRETDILARLGGDEFVILLSELNTTDDDCDIVCQVEKLADKLVTALAEPYTLNGKQRLVTASVGGAICQGENITSAELTRRADDAMYVAKNAGKNAFHIASSD